jgi:hypothetical protein
MTGDNVTKGYDLFGDHGRNLPTPHGSGTRPMYADMGKSCAPDPNRKRTYPEVVALFCLDSHNTSFFFKREDGTYYWLHARKDKDDEYVDANNLQLEMFENPILSKEFVMNAIL